MKTFIFFLFAILSGFPLKAQYFIWSEPVPLTDSLSDNTNACLYVGDPLFSWGNSILVWEQSDDSVSTAIYARNLDTMEDPFPLLSQPGVHFRNPQRILTDDQQIWFFLLYETDLNGNWDIYSVQYLRDGTLTSPVPLCGTSADELNFRWNSDLLTWQRNGAILVSDYSPYNGFPPGTEPLVLDSGNCQNPACSYAYCVWEKVVGSISRVWYAEHDYTGGQWIWTTPEVADSSGDNSRLFLGEATHPSIMAYQNKENDLWKIIGVDLYDMEEIEMPYFPLSNNVAPWFLEVMIPVDPISWSPFAFLTWASDTTGIMEIFANSEPGSQDYINISENDVPDSSPRLYAIYNSNVIRVYLIWESYRNDHWQLWMTYQDIITGIPDEEGIGSMRKVAVCPNPFSETTTIRFNTSDGSGYRMQVFSSNGQEVLSRRGTIQQPGLQEITWDGSTDRGEKPPAGMYLIIILTENQILQGKVILQD